MLELIHAEDLRRCRIEIVSIGGMIVYRPFKPFLYLAPFAPERENEKLLEQVPKEDREEITLLWRKMQKKVKNLLGNSS